MDYKGQQLAEYIYYIITFLFGAVAWVVGFIHNDFKYTFWGWLIGLMLSLLICIPDWPFFNRNKVTWSDEFEASLQKPKSKSKKSKKETTSN